MLISFCDPFQKFLYMPSHKNGLLTFLVVFYPFTLHLSLWLIVNCFLYTVGRPLPTELVHEIALDHEHKCCMTPFRQMFLRSKCAYPPSLFLPTILIQ